MTDNPIPTVMPLTMLRRLMLDIVAWFAGPTLFLYAYVAQHHVSGQAVRPHLFVALLALLTVFTARLALYLVAGAHRIRSVLTALIVSSAVSAILLYYGSVLIGLQSWGRVISWELIATYWSQAAPFAEAVGISLPLIAGMLLLAYAAILTGVSNALVVITSDHGESLGEHGVFSHANAPTEEQLRIPLLIIAYGYEPERPLHPKPSASQLDVGPTILAELGMPLPSTWVGVPLQDAMVPDFTYFQQGHVAGLFDHRDAGVLWKYAVDSRSGREQAFNLNADKRAINDVIASIPIGLKHQWRQRYLQTLAGGTGVLERPKVSTQPRALR